MILVRGVLHDIMHSDDTQVCHSLAYYVRNPRRDLRHIVHDTRSTYPRRDYNRY